MWTRGLAVGSAAAFGMAMLMPQTALRMGREAVALGQSVNRAMQREMLRAAAEAAEVIEDLLAEIRADAAAAEGRGAGQGPLPEVLAGRAVSGGAAVQPQAADAAVLHRAGGRLRLRLLGAGGPEELAALAAALRAFPGVTRIEIRPATMCLVLQADAPAGQLAAALERAGLLRLAPLAFRHPAAIATSVALARLDLLIRARSRGQANLRTVLAMVLRAVDTIRSRQGF
ncbi:hypothetical protein LNKW23_06020 [Paralimibaculum aggregatum]|uniref:Uncharacterized protein n=1 Tax=Paralimibaculum aggregatum TaxID=3036245 RepID=A0ABQ6LL51_9RHOB|nr:hypothetical protein [Limibaculum sp. NKW23]GMG81389.1 hypothetical protein LNKW23_06020 [Limibaculum sp. NKW23]